MGKRQTSQKFKRERSEEWAPQIPGDLEGSTCVCTGKMGEGPVGYLSLADHGALHEQAVKVRTDVQSAWTLNMYLPPPQAETLLAQGI